MGEIDPGDFLPVLIAVLRRSAWRDVERTRRVLTVRGTKTQRSRREVPLTSAALEALDSLPARLDSPYVFAGPRRGPFDLANFRRREWGRAIESAGVKKPARLYDLRSTFASNALAAGITVSNSPGSWARAWQ